eukprot:jgi/Undpi1/1187/HiC_scaffold_10.g04649.m1
MKANPSAVVGAVDERPSQCLTMSLIAECTKTDSSSAGDAGADGNTDERHAMADGILRTEILRLDWQRIASIQNLDIFTSVRELYLQHNRIEKIEELDTLRSLEFLALGSNRIRRVENLRHLNKLQVLDLSNNMVKDVDTQELPRNLTILNLANNPCCQDPDLQRTVICALPGLMKARQFCIENGLHDEEEGALRTLTVQMEEAIGEKSGVRLDQPDRPAQTPESTNTTSGSNDTNLRPTDTTSGSHHTTLGSKQTALGYNHKVSASTGRLQAIANLQKARARALQESTASFEQHKSHLLTTTRKAVEQKTAAAQGRSTDLEEATRKILDDARSELQLRRARVSAENKRFASDMKRKVDSALAERRQESKASALKGVARTLSDAALIATTGKPIDTDTTTAADKPMTTPLFLFSA